MNDIRQDCEKLLVHIKKCKSAMEWDGYTNSEPIVYIIKLPFKKLHRFHFAKIEMYTEKLRTYIRENGMDMELEVFEELNNQAILYSPSQLSSLGYKQFQHRINYLDTLRDNVTMLLKQMDVAV